MNFYYLLVIPMMPATMRKTALLGATILAACSPPPKNANGLGYCVSEFGVSSFDHDLHSSRDSIAPQLHRYILDGNQKSSVMYQLIDRNCDGSVEVIAAAPRKGTHIGEALWMFNQERQGWHTDRQGHDWRISSDTRQPRFAPDLERAANAMHYITKQQDELYENARTQGLKSTTEERAILDLARNAKRELIKASYRAIMEGDSNDE
jgi:hypothetical protein